MAEKLVTLEQWGAAVYGDAAPTIATLRTWARDGKIYPAPRKHGRAYFVAPDACYVDPRLPVQTSTAPPRGRLVMRLKNGGKAA